MAQRNSRPGIRMSSLVPVLFSAGFTTIESNRRLYTFSSNSQGQDEKVAHKCNCSWLFIGQKPCQGRGLLPVSGRSPGP